MGYNTKNIVTMRDGSQQTFIDWSADVKEGVAVFSAEKDGNIEAVIIPLDLIARIDTEMSTEIGGE